MASWIRNLLELAASHCGLPTASDIRGPLMNETDRFFRLLGYRPPAVESQTAISEPEDPTLVRLPPVTLEEELDLNPELDLLVFDDGEAARDMHLSCSPIPTSLLDESSEKITFEYDGYKTEALEDSVPPWKTTYLTDLIDADESTASDFTIGLPPILLKSPSFSTIEPISPLVKGMVTSVIQEDDEISLTEYEDALSYVGSDVDESPATTVRAPQYNQLDQWIASQMMVLPEVEAVERKIAAIKEEQKSQAPGPLNDSQRDKMDNVEIPKTDPQASVVTAADPKCPEQTIKANLCDRTTMKRSEEKNIKALGDSTHRDLMSDGSAAVREHMSLGIQQVQDGPVPRQNLDPTPGTKNKHMINLQGPASNKLPEALKQNIALAQMPQGKKLQKEQGQVQDSQNSQQQQQQQPRKKKSSQKKKAAENKKQQAVANHDAKKPQSGPANPGPAGTPKKHLPTFPGTIYTGSRGAAMAYTGLLGDETSGQLFSTHVPTEDRQLVLWTDASYHERSQRGGFSVVLQPTAGNPWQEFCWTVGMDPKIYRKGVVYYAEFLAIDAALEFAVKEAESRMQTPSSASPTQGPAASVGSTAQRHPPLKRVVVFSDCKQVLDSLNLGRQGTISRSPEHARRLQQLGIALELRWCPAHSGVLGNEKADLLAKLAVYHGPAPPQPWGKSITVTSLPVQVLRMRELLHATIAVPGQKGLKNPDDQAVSARFEMLGRDLATEKGWHGEYPCSLFPS
ncbi:hypothetical protein GQ53DRAFT_829668 [Thozetella sp. PMI_491]|nr:hypothetical protein GQ53DRAFT_829668 [Thozetella sp. PMI_491]